MRSLLVGCGEVGSGVRDALGDNLSAIYDPGMEEYREAPEGDFDVLLVAFGHSDSFIKLVENYQDVYNPKVTIIFSTVPVGTSRKLGALHSPVEGRHPKLGESIKTMRRWLGGYGPKDESTKIAYAFLLASGFNLCMADKPEFTEFLKLQSTTKYGVNLEFARYVKSVCDDLDMPFELIKEFDQDYNDLYQAIGMPQFQRYILDAPEGPLGGHCVVPNAKILDKQYPNILVREVYKNSIILEEVEKCEK